MSFVDAGTFLYGFVEGEFLRWEVVVSCLLSLVDESHGVLGDPWGCWVSGCGGESVVGRCLYGVGELGVFLLWCVVVVWWGSVCGGL